MIPAVTDLSSITKLENTKKEIRSLLISVGSRDITLLELSNMYKNILDRQIPFKEFYYTSLKDFLNSMPEVLSLRYNKNNELCAYHIDTNKSKHISNLVAKEKKKSCSNKSKFQLYNNSINPYILSEILQEFKISSTYRKNKNKISKNDVLSSITNRIGLHSFYTIQNLNNQLYELSHILTHDDKYIYLKKEFFYNKDNKQNEQVSRIQKSKIYNNHTLQKTIVKNDQRSKSINDNLSKKSLVSVLIKDTTKFRLKKLIDKHVDGIRCSELPAAYRQEYGIELEYANLGFNSIIEFVSALSDIIQINKPQNSKNQSIINSRVSMSNIQILKRKIENLQDMDLHKLNENEETHTKPIPTKLSLEVSKSLIPQWAMNIGENIDQLRVTSLFTDSNKYLDIIVAEVKNPSCFWIVLKKQKKIINQLMHQLHEFYNQQNLDKYKVPEILLQTGLHIACIYAEVWHRGIIKNITTSGLVVFFYDYGTIKEYNINDIYFLDKKFSTVPTQAIHCSLHNVKPLKTKKWSKEVTKEFKKQVLEKFCIASICNVDEQTNSMEINVIDINNNVNKKSINDWMVSKELAEWETSSFTKNNTTFNFYKEYLHNKKKKLSITQCTNELSINANIVNNEISEVRNIFTENYVSCDKKLKALKLYKEKFLNSSQAFSSVIYHDTNDNDQEKEIIKIKADNLNDKEIVCFHNSDLTEKGLNAHKLTHHGDNNTNFLKDNNSDKSNEKIFKRYNNKNRNCNKTASDDFSNIIKEL